MLFVLKELCLEVTNSCPLACVHCSTSSVRVDTPATRHLPISAAKDVVREFKQLGGEILEISGGEPLFYPPLELLVEEAVALGLEVYLYTSGIVVEKDSRLRGLNREMANNLRAAGISRVIFNLEGATPEIHERIVGVQDTYKLVLQGIQHTKSAGLWTGVHFVPMRLNFREIEPLMDLCTREAVNELALLRFVPHGRGDKNRALLEIEPAEFNDFLGCVAHLGQRYRELNIRVGCPMDFLALYDESREPHHCKAGLSTCLISPEGNVSPCPAFKHASAFVAGNIFQEALSSIWRTKFKVFRQFDFHKIQGECSQCLDLEWCQGRCLAQRFVEYDDLYQGPDPACPRQLRASGEEGRDRSRGAQATVRSSTQLHNSA